MKKVKHSPKRFTKSKYAWVVAGSLMLANAAYAYDHSDNPNNIQQRDPKYATATTADCVHGGTGTSANLDCSSGRANRSTNDTNAYNADTAFLNGAYTVRKNANGVDPRDGMTAQSTGPTENYGRY